MSILYEKQKCGYNLLTTMEHNFQQSREKSPATHLPPAIEEFVPRFTHIQEDLSNLFNIEVTSEASLRYDWVKDEMYGAILEDLHYAKPFALDYMIEEELLTFEDLKQRGIAEHKEVLKTIIDGVRGQTKVRLAKLYDDLFSPASPQTFLH